MEKNKRKVKIILNALKHYLGKPLRLERAINVFRLIKKFRAGYVNFEISEKEKEILLKVLNNHRKRFFRMDNTFDIAQLVEETQKSIPINTSLGKNSLAKKWVSPDIP